MDAKAKRILVKTFWGAGGWKSGGYTCPDEDFQYAKSKGLMFDPLTITHDECVERLRQLHDQVITKERVARAFLHSLSTRKVHLRSALSSWALTHDLPLHSYKQRESELPGYSACKDCDDRKLMSDEKYENQDLNVLNFERVKWGGIRLEWLIYCLMDLECLSLEEVHTVSPEDVEILRRMIDAVGACADKDAARQLEKRWKGVFPSNQHERDCVLEIWGYAGLLQPQEKFRKERGRGTDFRSVDNWRGEDGYSPDKLQEYFGAYLT
ncbi:hypothetical protein DCC85_05800 [Paenibacillus sp. CAA11]|uniref:hypothetical protein n=1 Tax=Paenibacillus sp. CAA11 TaxID=1532905 RepID=UPI000D33DAC8|nr:hypothetical protein [Paenibacillus sp. CAA11]AWB43783.1 hypothetical protein DCC85_05800 [Paenibacillus sp. CAA11]